jgi:hypothetical protein
LEPASKLKHKQKNDEILKISKKFTGAWSKHVDELKIINQKISKALSGNNLHQGKGTFENETHRSGHIGQFVREVPARRLIESHLAELPKLLQDPCG